MSDTLLTAIIHCDYIKIYIILYSIAHAFNAMSRLLIHCSVAVYDRYSTIIIWIQNTLYLHGSSTNLQFYYVFCVPY